MLIFEIQREVRFDLPCKIIEQIFACILLGNAVGKFALDDVRARDCTQISVEQFFHRSYLSASSLWSGAIVRA